MSYKENFMQSEEKPPIQRVVENYANNGTQRGY